MRLCLLIPIACLLALPAYAGEPWQATYARWQGLRDPDAASLAFADGQRFLAEHPGWPEEKVIRLRTEAAALLERPDAASMERFCHEQPPISGRGMIACLHARAGDAAAQDQWLRQGWIQGDFSAIEEAALLQNYGRRLAKTDHLMRLDRLLYEKKSAAARRMYGLLPASVQPEAEVRIAIDSDARDAHSRRKKLPPELQRAPGVLFSRIQWSMRHGKEEELAALFLQAPKTVPYPDLWWPARALAAREALAVRRPDTALAIVAAHGAMKPENLSEALWFKGWLVMEYKRDAATAYQSFYKLYTAVGTPVSKARAAYWAGRAAARNGNPDIAREWMQKAARYGTTFYGQLAAQSLNPDTALALPAPPRFSADEKNALEAEDQAQVARDAAAHGDTKTRDQFITNLAAHAETPQRFALIAALAQELGGLSDRVHVAKQALRTGLVLTEDGWPIVPVPKNLPIEPALTLAIARQESEFDPNARSSADARGLMQLLPSTGRHVADKNLLPYGADTLFKPQENMTLGSIYLGQIINGFDGSYILGIASYNAGPANVRKWLSQYGPPPKNVHGAINWIESIPFSETRNYVMRVLENVQVYRARTQDAPLMLEQDLTR